MSANSKSARPKSPQANAAEQSKIIVEQTKAFFEKGGKINIIETGISGQPIITGRKHIKLDSSS